MYANNQYRRHTTLQQQQQQSGEFHSEAIASFHHHGRTGEIVQSVDEQMQIPAQQSSPSPSGQEPRNKVNALGDMRHRQCDRLHPEHFHQQGPNLPQDVNAPYGNSSSFGASASGSCLQQQHAAEMNHMMMMICSDPTRYIHSVTLQDHPSYCDGAPAGSPSNIFRMYNRALAFASHNKYNNHRSRTCKPSIPSVSSAAGSMSNPTPMSSSFTTFPDQHHLRPPFPQYTADVSAVLLYNTGLVFHQDGLVTGQSQSLIKALELYHMALSILDDPSRFIGRQQSHNFPIVDCTMLDNQNDPDQLVLLEMALYNNMGHIHSHFYNQNETRSCRELLRRRLTIMTERSRALHNEDYSFFYMNVAFSLDNQYFRFAPAA